MWHHSGAAGQSCHYPISIVMTSQECAHIPRPSLPNYPMFDKHVQTIKRTYIEIQEYCKYKWKVVWHLQLYWEYTLFCKMQTTLDQDHYLFFLWYQKLSFKDVCLTYDSIVNVMLVVICSIVSVLFKITEKVLVHQCCLLLAKQHI